MTTNEPRYHVTDHPDYPNGTFWQVSDHANGPTARLIATFDTEQQAKDTARAMEERRHFVSHNPYTGYQVISPDARVLYTYSHEDDARRAADALNHEANIAAAREAGQDIPPRPVVITSANIVPHFEEQPPAWKHTGAPSVIIIDAANPDHWQRYVWSYARTRPDFRAEIQTDRVPVSQFGYRLGYYPVDVDGWEMIPDGPYCAACIDPINDYANPNPRASHDYPQAFHAEMIESPDEDDDGNPIPRYCAGCGEPLYEPDEPEPAPHYHVVAFIPGCLNDYDSGPIDTIEEAREYIREYIQDGGMQPDRPTTEDGPDRYTNGPYVIKIEEPCTEDRANCEAAAEAGY